VFTSPPTEGVGVGAEGIEEKNRLA